MQQIPLKNLWTFNKTENFNKLHSVLNIPIYNIDI